MILKKETIEQLSKNLSLPFTGTEQDWDIEMANPHRINEFLKFYQHNQLTCDEKAAVMSLILASYEDFLHQNDLEIDERWEEITFILESEKEIFLDLLECWSAGTSAKEGDQFRITPLVSKLKLGLG